MNNFFKNIVLLVAVLLLSYFTATYFGGWYNDFSPLFSRSIFALTEQELIFLVGMPFAYIFFTTLLFKLFASGNINKWIGWLLAPSFIFFASGDLKHIYLPIILGLIAWGLATLLRKIFSPRPPLG